MAGGWAFVGTGSSGGTTTPGGNDTNIQFNNNGSFSGSALLTTDGSGSLSASVNISASAFYGDASNLTGVTASAVQVADGPEFALQWRYDSPVSGELSGSQALTWNTASSDLAVTGNINVVGDISASVNISGSELYVTDAYISSVPVNRVLVSTTSGEVTSHSALTFISDVLAVPDISASVNISGSGLYATNAYTTDSYISSVPINRVLVSTAAGKVTSHSALTFISDVLAVPDISASVNISGSGLYVTDAYVSSLPADRVLVSTTGGQLTSHSPLTFISDVLAVPDISASVNISGSGFYGDGSNLTGLSPGGSNASIQFNDNGSFNGSALLVTDGAGALSALTLETTSSDNGSISIGEGISYNFGGTPRLDIFENGFKLNTTQFYQAMSPVKTSNFNVQNFQVFPVNTSGSVVTGTLPGLTSDDDVGVTFTVKDSQGSGSTNNVVIAASGSQEIDTASQVKIQVNFGSITVMAISGASDYFWSIASTSP